MKISDAFLKFFIRQDISIINEKEKKTFFLDTIRSSVDGIEYTMISSVFLLIGIQYFHINDGWKSAISSATHIGLIFSLFATSSFGNIKSVSVLGYSTVLGGILLIGASFVNNAILYGLFVLAHAVCLYIRAPFFTSLYANNYDDKRRAKLYSAGIMLSILTGLASNYSFGLFLDWDLNHFRWIFLGTGVSIILSGLLLFKIPSEKVKRKKRQNPLKNLKLLFDYPIFGIVSLSWFIMGFANLWSFPLRLVYLIEPERGLSLSPFVALLIMGFIPNFTKLLFSNLWARIFDRVSFLPIRIITSLFMGVGIFFFFLTDNLIVIISAQILMYIGLACAPFIWNLWVTQVAPSGESQPFMSVHSFLCGIRGVLGPFAGFLFIQKFSMRAVGFISFAMVVLSIIILLPLLKKVTART